MIDNLDQVRAMLAEVQAKRIRRLRIWRAVWLVALAADLACIAWLIFHP